MFDSKIIDNYFEEIIEELVADREKMKYLFDENNSSKDVLKNFIILTNKYYSFFGNNDYFKNELFHYLNEKYTWIRNISGQSKIILESDNYKIYLSVYNHELFGSIEYNDYFHICCKPLPPERDTYSPTTKQLYDAYNAAIKYANKEITLKDYINTRFSNPTYFGRCLTFIKRRGTNTLSVEDAQEGLLKLESSYQENLEKYQEFYNTFLETKEELQSIVNFMNENFDNMKIIPMKENDDKDIFSSIEFSETTKNTK